MTQITLTPAAAQEVLDALKASLEAVGLGEVLTHKDHSPRDLRNIAEIMRETVLAHEEKRLAAKLAARKNGKS